MCECASECVCVRASTCLNAFDHVCVRVNLCVFVCE